MLAQRGFEPVVLPLTQTQTISGAGLPDTIDLVAITSAHAVRHASPELIAALRDRPTFAVGARTAEAARAAGLAKVEDAGGTAALLAASLIERTPIGGHIAYLCGTPRKPIVEAELRQSGRIVHAVETYATVRLVPNQAEVAALIDDGLDAVLVYSAESAVALLDLLASRERRAWQNAAFVCLSADIAEVLPRDLRISIAATPDELSLLACLERHFAAPGASA
jgi:uroporphyrinogen-III synthase